jgi:probable rRNA maturation factor
MPEDTSSFKIDWSSRSKLRGPGDKSLGELLKRLRDRFAPTAQGLSISYVDDRVMKKLNREHRGINLTTDVLSFPAEPEKGAFQHLGDLVICLPVAEKMAKKMKVSRRREIETLVIHGFLHLCGYDHEKDKGEMLSLQAQLEQELLGKDPLRMSLKRGRKPGSKLKTLKNGERVVVTGRAATALVRKEKTKKLKAKATKAAVKSAKKPKKVVEKKPVARKPKKAATPKPSASVAKRAPRRVKAPRLRSGVIA